MGDARFVFHFRAPVAASTAYSNPSQEPK